MSCENGRGRGDPSRDSFSVRQGRSCKSVDAVSADDWLHMVHDLCARKAPNYAAVSGDAETHRRRPLGDVSPWELLEPHVDEVLDSIKALLGCGRHDVGADDVHLLFAASMAVPRHLTLWGRASSSRALEPALTALLDTCARADDTYRNNVLVPQMAWHWCSRGCNACAIRSGRGSSGMAQWLLVCKNRQVLLSQMPSATQAHRQPTGSPHLNQSNVCKGM